MIKHILFDLDGTLIDSSGGIIEAFNFALQKFGLSPQPSEMITPMIGFPVEMMFQKVTGENITGLKNCFREKAKETVVASALPLDGADDAVLSLFNRNLKLGIATTKIRSHIDGILEKLDWNKYFEAVIGGDEVNKVKPHPEQFEALMNLLHGNKDTSIVVGDTTNDLLAARQLGLKTVAVRSPYGTSDDVLKLNPEYFIRSINQLPDLLEDLNYAEENSN